MKAREIGSYKTASRSRAYGDFGSRQFSGGDLSNHRRRGLRAARTRSPASMSERK